MREKGQRNNFFMQGPHLFSIRLIFIQLNSDLKKIKVLSLRLGRNYNN